MKTDELRKRFLDFFQHHGHTVKPSSSLVPAKDPSLLFTNAGMVPFKDQFLGQEKLSYPKATSSQRCMRAGGKHNDLDNVGYTARHHTFFEMLGNFSFGDYFKEHAIELAWIFLTKELNIPPAKLWITTYHSDHEARQFWLKQGVSPDRMSTCGDADNFWSMGDVGPCGPCTEIFFDHGPDVAGTEPGEQHEGDRYVEIWNLVFMQYNRDDTGKLTDLPKPCVDTGMGLERIAAVLQGVHDNYSIDIFQPIYQSIYAVSQNKTIDRVALKVIADHARAATFMVWDQILPSNEGRGYVLRRIIRRALRYGFQQGIRDPFFSKLVASVSETMRQAYPKLQDSVGMIAKVIHAEEEQFSRTLASGMKLLKSHLESSTTLPGDVVFKLYDSYGFPTDLTRDIAKEKSIAVDWQGFEKYMAQQKDRSRSHQAFKQAGKNSADYPRVETLFCGYEGFDASSQLCYLANQGAAVNRLTKGQVGDVIVNKTPFYAESGGQVGDVGWIKTPSATFQVKDTQRYGSTIVHHGVVTEGELCVDEVVDLSVDSKRKKTMQNHTATHLLHAALQSCLGSSVFQKGSLVAPDRLRFDFSHKQALTRQEISEIEQWVNRHIQLDLKVSTEEMALEVAKNKGVMALFDEKYDEQVRVLSIGDVSHELCGGTHVTHTGSIGYFKITSETAVASGVRRIEAVTGVSACQWLDGKYHLLQDASKQLETSVDQVVNAVTQQKKQYTDLAQSSQVLEQQFAQVLASQIFDSELVDLSKCQVIVAQVKQCHDVKRLRLILDACYAKSTGPLLMTLIGNAQHQKSPMVIAVDSELAKRVSARDLLNELKTYAQVKAGGKPTMVQGTIDCNNFSELRENILAWVKNAIS